MGKVKKITVKLENLFQDKPTLNNRIYTKEVFDSFAKQINEGEVYLNNLVPYEGKMDIRCIIGKVGNAVIKDNELYVDITSLNLPNSWMLGFIEENKDTFKVYTSCIADIDSDNKVKDAKLICLYPAAGEPAQKKV